MRIRREVLLLALLQSIVILAQNNYHNTADKHVEKKRTNSTLHKLWKRARSCPDGEYPTEAHCCKMCNAGTYAESACTENHGSPVCKDCSEGLTYMAVNNGYHECHRCTSCDKGSGEEMKEPCSVTQNTICSCAKDFFCLENRTDEFTSCKSCKHCTKCEYGYVTICEANQDAVCKTPRRHYILIVPFTGFILLLLGCLCWAMCCTKTDRQPRGQAPSVEIGRKTLTLPGDLKDIDLSDLLAKFSEKMDFSTVLSAVRAMNLPNPRIDAILHDYKDHCEEQKFQLLREWYENTGRTTAFDDLISTLQANKKQVAEQLIQIAKSHRQQS